MHGRNAKAGRLEEVWRREGTAGAVRWVEAQGRRGYAALVQAVEGGSRRARRLLRHLACRNLETVRSHLEGLLGKGRAEALLAALRVPLDLAPAEVLAQVELAAAGEFGEEYWPAAGLLGARLVAGRARGGRDWGLALLGARPAGTGTVEREGWLFGSRIGPRRAHGRTFRCRPIPRRETVVLAGPWGERTFRRVSLGVGPKAQTAALAAAALRALLRREPDLLWGVPAEWVRALELEPEALDPFIVVDLTERKGLRALTPRDREGRLRLGESTLFRSLARALAQRDAALVKP